MANQELKGKYPVSKRSFTDVIFCIVFICFSAFSIVGAVYGFRQGTMNNIVVPFDDSGNACGRGSAAAYKFLFFVAPKNTDLTKRNTVCVKSCPPDTQTKVDCFPNKQVPDCSAVDPYITTDFVERFCIPKSVSRITQIQEKLHSLALEGAAADISNSWQLFLVAVLISFVVSMLYCYLLEYFAQFIVTFLIIGLLASLTFLGFILEDQYKKMIQNNDTQTENQNYYYYGARICWGLAIWMTLMICCLWNRIMLAIKIIQATADFITDYQRILIVPVLLAVFLLAYICYWGLAAVYIFSVGEVVHKEGRIYGRVAWTTQTKVFWYTHLVSLLWNVSFMLYLSQFMIIVTAVTWYFAPKKSELGSPISNGLIWGITYHVGSIALGSLVLSTIWSLQVTLAYLQQQAEELKTADNTIIKWALSIMQVLVECFERFVKFVNKHAYIEIAMKSTGFCTGAFNAMGMIISNALRVGVLHGLCSIVIGFGTLFIVASTTLASFYLLTKVSYFNSKVMGYLVPLVIVGMISYVVGKLFGHVFDVSADAMIHCYITEESESNSRSQVQNSSSQGISKVINDAKKNNTNLLSEEPAPGYGKQAVTLQKL